MAIATFAIFMVILRGPYERTITCTVHSTAIESWVACTVVSSYCIVADGIHLTFVCTSLAFVDVWKWKKIDKVEKFSCTKFWEVKIS